MGRENDGCSDAMARCAAKLLPFAASSLDAGDETSGDDEASAVPLTVGHVTSHAPSRRPGGQGSANPAARRRAAVTPSARARVKSRPADREAAGSRGPHAGARECTNTSDSNLASGSPPRVHLAIWAARRVQSAGHGRKYTLLYLGVSVYSAVLRGVEMGAGIAYSDAQYSFLPSPIPRCGSPRTMIR
jgi:hypothetical protein